MVLGNSVDASVTGFQSLNAATGAWNGRTLTAGTGISITNGDGTVGNPTISNTSPAVGSGTASFGSQQNGDVVNATGDGTVYQVICNTNRFNNSGGYNSGTGVFTVPVTGIYLLTFNVAVLNLSALHTGSFMGIQVNGTFQLFGNEHSPGPVRTAINNAVVYTGSGITNLSSGDLVTLHIEISGSTKTVTVGGTPGSGAPGITYFSASLLS